MRREKNILLPHLCSDTVIVSSIRKQKPSPLYVSPWANIYWSSWKNKIISCIWWPHESHTLLKAMYSVLEFEIGVSLVGFWRPTALKERQSLEMKDFPRGKLNRDLRWTRERRWLYSRYLTIVFQQLFLELWERKPVLWGAGAIVIKTHLVQLNSQEKHMHWYKLFPQPTL